MESVLLICHFQQLECKRERKKCCYTRRWKSKLSEKLCLFISVCNGITLETDFVPPHKSIILTRCASLRKKDFSAVHLISQLNPLCWCFFKWIHDSPHCLPLLDLVSQYCLHATLLEYLLNVCFFYWQHQRGWKDWHFCLINYMSNRKKPHCINMYF